MVNKKSLLEDPIFQNLFAAIAATIARLVNLRTAGAYDQAYAEIEAHLDELIGLKYNQIRYLDDDFILDLLTVNDIIDVERLWYMAALIDTRGEILTAQGHREEGQDCRLRALGFFIDVAFSTAEPIIEVDEKIDGIANRLWLELPEEVLFSLYSLYELRGAYDRALAALDRLIEGSGDNPDLVDERRQYLQRLSRKADEEINSGNLSLSQAKSLTSHKPKT